MKIKIFLFSEPVDNRNRKKWTRCLLRHHLHRMTFTHHQYVHPWWVIHCNCIHGQSQSISTTPKVLLSPTLSPPLLLPPNLGKRFLALCLYRVILSGHFIWRGLIVFISVIDFCINTTLFSKCIIYSFTPFHVLLMYLACILGVICTWRSECIL